MAISVLLEGELLNGYRLRAERMAREHTGHAQADIPGVVGITQSFPGRIFRSIENLADIARIDQFVPFIHAKQCWISAGEKRRMGGAGNLAKVTQQLHVCWEV